MEPTVIGIIIGFAMLFSTVTATDSAGTSDAAIAIAGGLSFLVIIMSFVGGLLGWILIMKKKILQCTNCGAKVSAS